MPGQAAASRLHRLSPLDGHGDPILTTVDAKSRSGASIPFIELADGLVLAAIRESGVPLQRIRPLLTLLDEEFGIQHALTSWKLYTDGAEFLLDISTDLDDPPTSKRTVT